MVAAVSSSAWVVAPRVISKIQPTAKADYLYATTLPDEEQGATPTAGALLYSKKSLSSNSLVPTSGVMFLKASDGETNFFIDPSSTRLNLVANSAPGSFSLYVYDTGAKTAEKYSFAASADNKSLVATSDTAISVNTLELSKSEVSTGRDIDGNTKIGASVQADGNDTDTENGLFHMSVADQDVYAVSTSFATAKSFDISAAALTNSDGTFWAPDESNATLRAIGPSDGDDHWRIYASTSTSSDVTEYTFSRASLNEPWELGNNGTKTLTHKEFALIEATNKRDLNNDSNFGAKVNKALDAHGGLYQTEVLGATYFVAGKSLTSSASKPLSLGQAFLTEDGTEAWQPESVAEVAGVKQMRVVSGVNGFDIYAKETDGVFAKYQFDADYKLTADRTEMSKEEMATAEKDAGRDLTGDGYIGARITGNLDAKSNVLYTAKVDSGDPVFLRSDIKLTLDSKDAKKAVDLSKALKTDTGYWALDAANDIKASYIDKNDNDKLKIITVNKTDANDVKQYTFDKTTNLLIDDESGSLDAATLAAAEVTLKRDLNGDTTVGLKNVVEVDKVGKLYRGTALGDDYLVVSDKLTGAKDLSQALRLSDGTFWTGPEGFDKATDKMVMFKMQGGGYEVYSSMTGGTYVKNTFNASFENTDEDPNGKILTAVELADAEVDISRDINGDKLKGANVTATITKGAVGTPGLYTASIGSDNVVLVAESITLKGTKLGDKALLGEDGSTPWSTTETLKGVLKSDGGTGFEVYTKAGNDVMRYKFSSDRVYEPSDVEKLSSEELVAVENLLKKDVDGDAAVGAKIDETTDRVTGLFKASVLGQTYYVEGQNLKSGKAGSAGVSLDKAFMYDDTTAWKPETGHTIAGMVKSGTDFMVFSYNAAKTSVLKTTFDSDHKFQESVEVDPVELVGLEATQRRDFNNDGAIGFNALAKGAATYQGVSEAKVIGNTKYWLVGDNLQPGTKGTPLSLSNALLNDDGTGPWNPNVGETIKAVLTNGNDRFVYTVNGNDVFKYTFDKATSKVGNGGNSELVSAVELATAEKASKKDLNGDTKVGFVAASELLDSSRSTGLINVSALGKDYLVVRSLTDKPIDLSKALMNADGTGPWAVDSDVTIKGTYQPAGQDFEVFGTKSNGAGTDIVRYKFSAAADGTLKLAPDGNITDYAVITGINLATREADAKKDLNGDSSIGFKVGNASIATQASNGWALGDASVESDAENSKIYIVGKNLSAKGTMGNNLANSAALLDSNATNGYWKPDADYSVKSIVEALTGNEVTVYAQKVDTENNNAILTTAYLFKNANAQWSLDSTASKDSADLLVDEVTAKRDLNGDGTVGLSISSTITASSSTSAGLYEAKIDNNTYYLVGKDLASGTSLKPLDSSKALTDGGSTWVPSDAAGLSLEMVTQAMKDDQNSPAPADSVYKVTDSGSAVYFKADFSKTS